jgi:hypothetical protein
MDIDDILRLIFGVTGGRHRDDAQRERAVRIVLDGIRSSQPARDGRGL